MNGTLAVRAPAKVNLFLEVPARRPDGYHEIATLMLAISLADTVTFAPAVAGEIVLTCDDLTLTTGPENLVRRAAELLRRHTGYPGGATITLRKRVPMQAGLGGGSSDAASTLVGLNRLWQLNLGVSELMALAAQLGSDVPFFLAGPAAWCTGRGEVIEPVRVGRALDLVLVCPATGLATAAVYAALTVPTTPVDGSPVRQALEAGDLTGLAAGLFNRLQPVAEQLNPELTGWLKRLAGEGLGSLMTGSGSAMFVLCQDRRAAIALARRLKRDGSGSAAGLGTARVFLVRGHV